MHSSEMPLVDKSQHPILELEAHVPVNAPAHGVGGSVKPQQLSVKLEMHRDAPAIECQQEVLSAALDVRDLRARDAAIQESGGLWLGSDRMAHADAQNTPAFHERAQCYGNGFDFGRFRHRFN